MRPGAAYARPAVIPVKGKAAFQVGQHPRKSKSRTVTSHVEICLSSARKVLSLLNIPLRRAHRRDYSYF